MTRFVAPQSEGNSVAGTTLTLRGLAKAHFEALREPWERTAELRVPTEDASACGQ